MREGQGKIRSLRAHVIFLQPGRHQTQANGQGEERQGGQHVRLPAESAALPPEDQQDGSREGESRRLGQQRSQEEDQRQKVKERGAWSVERGVVIPLISSTLRLVPALRITQVRQSGAQVKGQREYVLAFGDPGGGLDHDRMQGKEGGGQAGAGNFEPEEQAPEEQGGQGMQQEVLDVIGRRPEPPQMVIQPKGCAGERVILLQRGGLKPIAHKPAVFWNSANNSMSTRHHPR